MSRERIVVAMSGGVDSSVAAGLLLREGYDVIGVTMRLWAPEDVQAPRYHKRCCSVEDIDDARSAADVLGIPHYVVNMEREFMANVVDYFVAEYSRGRTPNPCLPCNEHVKFRALVQRAKAMEARYLATGHYVRLVESQGVYRLYRARDEAKDQSYVLYMLGQEDLAGVRFPIGAFEKDEIRELAMEMGLPNASQPESADIGFLPSEDYRDSIADGVPPASGAGVNRDGGVGGRESVERKIGLWESDNRVGTAECFCFIKVRFDRAIVQLTAVDGRWISSSRCSEVVISLPSAPTGARYVSPGRSPGICSRGQSQPQRGALNNFAPGC